MRNLIQILLFLVALTAHARYENPLPGGFPTEETAQTAREERDFQRAMIAYRYFYPTVSMEAVMNANRALDIPDSGGFVQIAAQPHHIVFTGNSDTPYAAGNADLRITGPLVIEMPKGAFVGLVNDHHQGWLTDLGLSGPDKGQGGKHLILPINYKGHLPDGYFVSQAKTNMIFVAVRAIPQKDADALKSLADIKVYPLADPVKVFSFTDITVSKNFDATSLRFEDNLSFWRILHKIIQEEPVPNDHADMYGLLNGLGIKKGADFEPDSNMVLTLIRAAKAGRDQMLVSAFASDRADRFVWKDRKWEWVGLVPGNASFKTDSGIDLEARDRWFAQAILTSPAMSTRAKGAGSLYWLGHRDNTAAFLDGSKTYRLRVPKDVPANLFWSVTAYSAATRSQVITDQGRAAIRSLYETMLPNADGSIDLYFGPTAPAGREGQWVKTNPNEGWFSYFRIYGPTAAAFDESWKPGDFEQM